MCAHFVLPQINKLKGFVKQQRSRGSQQSSKTDWLVVHKQLREEQ